MLAPWREALVGGSLAAALVIARARRANAVAATAVADAATTSASPEMHPLSINQVETALERSAPMAAIGDTNVAELARRLAEALHRRDNAAWPPSMLPIAAEADDDDEDDDDDPLAWLEASGRTAAGAEAAGRDGDARDAGPVVIFAAQMAGNASPPPARTEERSMPPSPEWDCDGATRALETALATLRRTSG